MSPCAGRSGCQDSAPQGLRRSRLVQDMLAPAAAPVGLKHLRRVRPILRARRVTPQSSGQSALPRSFPSPFERLHPDQPSAFGSAPRIAIGVSTPTLSHISRAPQTPPPLIVARESGVGGGEGGGSAAGVARISLNRDVIPVGMEKPAFFLALLRVFGQRVARQSNPTSPLARQLSNVKCP